MEPNFHLDQRIKDSKQSQTRCVISLRIAGHWPSNAMAVLTASLAVLEAPEEAPFTFSQRNTLLQKCNVQEIPRPEHPWSSPSSPLALAAVDAAQSQVSVADAVGATQPRQAL